jgi:hypothetical protein
MEVACVIATITEIMTVRKHLPDLGTEAESVREHLKDDVSVCWRDTPSDAVPRGKVRVQHCRPGRIGFPESSMGSPHRQVA